MSAGTRTVAVNAAFLSRPVTGVQRYAREMMGALARTAGGRYRLVSIAPVRPGAVPPHATEGAELVADRSRLPAPLWIQLRLPALLRRLGGPLLWSPANIGPLAVTNQILTVFDASVFARPEWYSRGFRLYYRALLPRVARRVERVLTVSEFSRGELERHGVAPAGRIAVVPCGVSREFHPGADSSEWEKRKPYLLAVGSRDPRKNLATLLEAFRLLPPELARGLRLLVAGGGSPVFAREGLAALPPGVEILGYVPDWSLPGLYAGAEALVFPSLYEGFGLPPLEAMASGTPVLVSRAASLPETCGEAALYCNPLDTRGLAEGMARLLTDTGLKARLRSAGLERAAAFTWERAAGRLLAVLDEVLDAREGAPSRAPA